MDIKKAIVETTIEVLPMYGLSPVFNGEVDDERLICAEYFNVIMGVSGAMKGNMVITAGRSAALKIVSAMLGGMECNCVDDMAKSAMGELLNIIAGNALIKVKADSHIHISTPTLVIGEKICILVNRIRSSKLAFNMDGHLIDISFSIE